jgi:hypothetical protein
MKTTITNISLFLLLLSLSISCKKDDGFITSNSAFYFTAKVNGQTVKFEAEEVSADYKCNVTGLIQNWMSGYDIYEGTMLQDQTTPNKNQIRVMILKYFDHYPNYQTEVTTMIQPGNYAYGFGDASNSTVNGAVVYYIDANGLAWYTEGPQDGSSFKVTEVKDNPTGSSVKIFTAQFSCKLYSGTAAVLEIKNATIRGKVFP